MMGWRAGGDAGSNATAGGRNSSVSWVIKARDSAASAAATAASAAAAAAASLAAASAASMAGQRVARLESKELEGCGSDEDEETEQDESSKVQLEPQLLFKFPPGKKLALSPSDLPGFCFPNGIKATVLRRSPSMSDLHRVIFGQAYQRSDNSAFVFLLKVANNETLYGVCMVVEEIVQRPPGVLAVAGDGAVWRDADDADAATHTQGSREMAPEEAADGGVGEYGVGAGGGFRCVVTAPRCYCILSRVPCIELHFEVLRSIPFASQTPVAGAAHWYSAAAAPERLDRIKQHSGAIAVPRGLSMPMPMPTHNLMSRTASIGASLHLPSISSRTDAMAAAARRLGNASGGAVGGCCGGAIASGGVGGAAAGGGSKSRGGLVRVKSRFCEEDVGACRAQGGQEGEAQQAGVAGREFEGRGDLEEARGVCRPEARRQGVAAHEHYPVQGAEHGSFCSEYDGEGVGVPGRDEGWGEHEGREGEGEGAEKTEGDEGGERGAWQSTVIPLAYLQQLHLNAAATSDRALACTISSSSSNAVEGGERRPEFEAAAGCGSGVLNVTFAAGKGESERKGERGAGPPGMIRARSVRLPGSGTGGLRNAFPGAPAVAEPDSSTDSETGFNEDSSEASDDVSGKAGSRRRGGEEAGARLDVGGGRQMQDADSELEAPPARAAGEGAGEGEAEGEGTEEGEEGGEVEEWGGRGEDGEGNMGRESAYDEEERLLREVAEILDLWEQRGERGSAGGSGAEAAGGEETCAQVWAPDGGESAGNGAEGEESGAGIWGSGGEAHAGKGADGEALARKETEAEGEAIGPLEGRRRGTGEGNGGEECSSSERGSGRSSGSSISSNLRPMDWSRRMQRSTSLAGKVKKAWMSVGDGRGFEARTPSGNLPAANELSCNADGSASGRAHGQGSAEHWARWREWEEWGCESPARRARGESARQGGKATSGSVFAGLPGLFRNLTTTGASRSSSRNSYQWLEECAALAAWEVGGGRAGRADGGSSAGRAGGDGRAGGGDSGDERTGGGDAVGWRVRGERVGVAVGVDGLEEGGMDEEEAKGEVVGGECGAGHAGGWCVCEEGSAGVEHAGYVEVRQVSGVKARLDEGKREGVGEAEMAREVGEGEQGDASAGEDSVEQEERQMVWEMGGHAQTGRDYGAAAVEEWAQQHGNDSLRIVCAYHRMPLPPPAQPIAIGVFPGAGNEGCGELRCRHQEALEEEGTSTFSLTLILSCLLACPGAACLPLLPPGVLPPPLSPSSSHAYLPVPVPPVCLFFLLVYVMMLLLPSPCFSGCTAPSRA
ncbi:unnamed protein product [Closterium sp. NIES-64]|nr:unnamed protein product [Closterium sp. NIES-64]